MAKKPTKKPKKSAPRREKRTGPGIFGVTVMGLFAALAALAGAIFVLGDPRDASPQVNVALDLSALPLKGTRTAEPARPEPVVAPTQAAVQTAPELPELAEEVVAAAPIQKVDVETERETPAAVGRLRPPDPSPLLQDDAATGQLPAISDSGLRSDSYYTRPFDGADGRPRIALIIGGMGLSQTTTRAAIRDLPPEVTLSFVPYARDLENWTNQARAAGHELMLEIPMEPYDYPQNDPGPYTLLTSNSRKENEERLEWLMSRFSGYFAVTNYLGAKFSTSNTSMLPMMRTLEQRGVAYIDTGASQRSVLRTVAHNVNSNWTVVDRVIDIRVAEDIIDRNLLELEALALQNGAALGRGSGYPLTIESIVSWTKNLEAKGYVLAPASAVLELRTGAGRP